MMTNSEGMPVISIVANCLPEAWEKAVLAVWDNGYEVKTQYDKAGDPPSKDATVMVAITDPFAEPRIHKNFPGGPEELEAYRQEVVDGIHDHWIDPAAGKWTYTYHERLFAYRPVQNLRDPKSPKPFAAVNQIQYIIDALSETSHTRRAQAVTWMPTADPQTDDPPCLQRIWCRLRGRLGRPAPTAHEHALAQSRPVQGVVHERLRVDGPPAHPRATNLDPKGRTGRSRAVRRYQ